MRLTGGCLCGAVRYRVDGEMTDAAHCHCRICQRASGSGFITWGTFPASAFAYEREEPAAYRSSGEAVREFCGRCGTQLVFRADHGENVDITIASLDEPDAIMPQGNIWVGSRRLWCHGFDRDLPDFDGEMA